MSRTRIAKLAVVAVLAASCTNGFIKDTGFPADIEQALEALPRVEVMNVGADGLPTFLRGDLGFAATGKADLATAEGMLAPAVAAIAPCFRVEAANLRLTALQTDDLGFTHARYRQDKNGLEVVGGELIVHLDVTGVVYAANGSARDGLEVDANPALDGNLAMQRARAAADPAGSFSFGARRLVYVVASADSSLHLAWETVQDGFLGADPVYDLVYVDAHTGDVVERRPTIIYARSRKVYSANNGTSLPGTLKISEGGATVSDTSVMGAYNNTGTTYDCYKALFNRDSYNNSGATLVSTVHYSSNYVNAYWNGSQMVFGDGDGYQASSLALGLDVVAHELTHAVTTYTANLNYSYESGALNEGMSDILAATCEAWKDGGVSSDTWKIGEDIWTPGTSGDALRYMDNPTADGQSYDYYPERYTGSQDNGGVHLNSGIANLAFKLLVTGGKHPRNKTSVQVTGIGIDQASKIFYRALSQYMTSSTNFSGARTATVQAATDLYGATVAESVSQAWDAVGAPGGSPAPTPTTALTNGVPKSNLSGSAGTSLYFSLDVPAGASNLKFQLSGGSGDADLYVKLGSKPTTTTNDYKSEGSTTAESVSPASATQGTWYVLVYAYASFSGATIVGSYDTGTPTPTPDPTPTPTPGTVLQNGVPVSSLSGAAGAEQRWTFDVPAGASNLSFKISGGTGDADLYVKFGTAPTTSSYDYRPYLDGNNETVTATVRTGTWHVMLRGYKAYSGVTLVASYSTGTPTPTPTPTPDDGLQNGVPVSISGAQSSQQNFTFTVPAGVSQVRFQMSGGTGDADLYVKFGAAPTTSSYDYRPYLDGNNESVTAPGQAGTWYIMVRGYSSFSGVSLVASY